MGLMTRSKDGSPFSMRMGAVTWASVVTSSGGWVVTRNKAGRQLQPPTSAERKRGDVLCCLGPQAARAGRGPPDDGDSDSGVGVCLW